MTANPFKAPVEPPMTFRDTCAVAAMQAILTGAPGFDPAPSSMREIAHIVYEMADLMLEARDARRVGR